MGKKLCILAVCTLWMGSMCSGPHRGDRKKSDTQLELAKNYLNPRKTTKEPRPHADVDGAEREAKRALELDPSNESVHLMLGAIDYVRAGLNYRQREQHSCLTGIDAEVRREQFLAHLRDADSHFQDALGLAPSLSEAYAYRGGIAILTEDYPAAVKHLTKALEKPERLSNITLTRSNLAWAYFHQKDYRSAAQHIFQALQFAPQDCASTHRLGRIYFARQEYDKALEQFENAASVCRPVPYQENDLYLLKVQKQLGNPLDATSCIKRAPKSCIALQCLEVAND